jgi:two-component system, response regulator PdtaR
VDPRKLRVLIVEDEFFIALDAEEQVKSLGHSVVGTAVSAEQAIRLAGAEKPDVVLMDIRLIGPVDGITAAQEIRSRYGVEAIFVTANTDSSTLARAESTEPLAVLQKPLTKDRLAAQLARLLTK